MKALARLPLKELHARLLPPPPPPPTSLSLSLSLLPALLSPLSLHFCPGVLAAATIICPGVSSVPSIFVLVSWLLQLLSAPVSLLFPLFLSWCPGCCNYYLPRCLFCSLYFCPGVPSVVSVICLGVPGVLLSVLMYQRFFICPGVPSFLSYVLVSRLFSLSSFLGSQ